MLDLGELRVDAFSGVRVEGQVVFGQPTGISQRQAHVLWLYFFIKPSRARIGRKIPSRARARNVQKIIKYHQASGAFVATLRRLAM